MSNFVCFYNDHRRGCRVCFSSSCTERAPLLLFSAIVSLHSGVSSSLLHPAAIALNQKRQRQWGGLLVISFNCLGVTTVLRMDIWQAPRPSLQSWLENDHLYVCSAGAWCLTLPQVKVMFSYKCLTKHRLGHCPPGHALVREHQNTSNHQFIWLDFDGFTSSKLEIESYRGQKLLRLKSHTWLHPRSRYTDGTTFPFFNQCTVCFCCSQASFSFQRKEIKKETRGCLQHRRPGPTVCNHPFLWPGLPETLGLTCWDRLVSQWHWSSSSDTSGEVRKLSAEWETLDKNSKVPLIPGFQQLVMLTNMPALLWWAQQKLAERWLNDNFRNTQQVAKWARRAVHKRTEPREWSPLSNLSGFVLTYPTFPAEKSFHGELPP